VGTCKTDSVRPHDRDITGVIIITENYSLIWARKDEVGGDSEPFELECSVLPPDLQVTWYQIFFKRKLCP
jgi:hypothetical protein